MLETRAKPYIIKPRRHEFFGLVHQFVPLASAAVRSADPVQVDGQSDYLIYAQAAVYVDGQAKVQFQTHPDKFHQEVPMYISALGTGQWPRVLASPLLIPRASTFTMYADDRQTVQAAQNIRVLHIGVKRYDQPFEGPRMYHTVIPFDYIANFTTDDSGIGPIAANGGLTYPTTISSDHDFDVHKVSILADGDATIQIETTGKALSWFNRDAWITLLGATNFNAAVPSGSWPFRLPQPVRVPSVGSIVTRVTDQSGASNRVMVIFHGLRLYPPRGMPCDERLIGQGRR